MVVSVHPLADEWTDEYSLFVVEHDLATYSRPLRHFLSDCRASRVRPVLLTRPGVTISPQLYTAMAESGAHWAFRDDEGVFDARSGLRIRSIADLWNGGGALDRHASVQAPGTVVPTLMFDIYAGDRATSDTLVGPLADHVVRGLGGDELGRFGRDEPLTYEWDHRELTAQVQAQMPASDPMLASSNGGVWASLTVARTSDGLVERVRGGLPMSGLAQLPQSEWRDAVMPSLTTTLEGLVADFRPRVALISSGMLQQVGDRYGFCVGAQPVDAPLAVLIGPRAVRDLRLDFDALSQRHDVTVLGPGRVPSALVRMTGRDPLWSQLRAFAFDLEQERLGAVLATEIQGWA